MKRIGLALLVAILFLWGRDAALAPPAAEAAPFGLTITKTCSSMTVPVGGSITCTITITSLLLPDFPEPVVVTLAPGAAGAGANNTYGRVRVTNAVATGDASNVVLNNPADGSPQIITINCFGPNCTFFFLGDQMVITETISGLVGGQVTETISFSNDPPDALAPITVLPAAVTGTLTCLPASITANSGAPGLSTCTATFADNDIFPATVSSGNVIVQLTGPSGAVIASTGTSSAQLRCGTQLNAPQGCTSMQFQVQSNSAAAGPVAVQMSYIPDVSAVDGQFSQTYVSAINVTAAPAGPVPNTGASLVVTGPASIACGALGTVTATLRDAGGNVVAVPTQVSFNTSIGTIGSPQTTAAGVASTALAAPATGNGGNALITAISGGLTSQTVVPMAACTTLPVSTTTNNNTTTTTTNNNTTTNPAAVAPYLPYLQPLLPYMTQPPVVQQPTQSQQQPIINVTINIPKEAFPQQPAQSTGTGGVSGLGVASQSGSGSGGSIFRPPNTGDGGLLTPTPLQILERGTQP